MASSCSDWKSSFITSKACQDQPTRRGVSTEILYLLREHDPTQPALDVFSLLQWLGCASSSPRALPANERAPAPALQPCSPKVSYSPSAEREGMRMTMRSMSQKCECGAQTLPCNSLRRSWVSLFAFSASCRLFSWASSCALSFACFFSCFLFSFSSFFFSIAVHANNHI